MIIQRLGNHATGWWADIDRLNKASVVYSAGLGVDVRFELDLIERVGCTVQGFDPTPSSIDWLKQQGLPKEFEIHGCGLAGEDRKAELFPLGDDYQTCSVYPSCCKSGADPVGEVLLRTVPTMMKQLGHTHIDLLKLDLWGCEYEVIENIAESGVPIKQLLVEWHTVPPGFNQISSWAVLENLHFHLYHQEVANASYVHVPPVDTNTPDNLFTMLRMGDAPAIRLLPKGYAIRRGSPADQDMWRLLVNKALSTVLPPRIVTSWFGDGRNIFFCEFKGQPVGTCGLSFRGNDCYISYTGVVPEHRGHGLGEALTCQALRLAKEGGYHKVFVATTLQPPQVHAIRMYFRLGFRYYRAVEVPKLTWRNLYNESKIAPYTAQQCSRPPGAWF